MARILLCIFLFLLSVLLNGQGLGTIVCPQPNDTVRNGELLIVFRINPGLNIKHSSLEVLIDNLNYNYLLKRNNNKLSLLITSDLKPGNKTIVIKGKDEFGNQYQQKCEFSIVRNNQQTRSKDTSLFINHKKIKVKASLDAFSRFLEITGDGAWLRQEPPETHNLNFRGNIQYRNINIPMKLHLTNHERPGLQPRDRFMIGVKSKRAGILFGDVNPRYHRLILNGARIRGGEAYVNFRNTQLNVVYGTINRAVEGLKLYYNSLENQYFPPVNLEIIPNQQDTAIQIQGYYNDPGIYSRKVIAADVTFGSSNTDNKVHVVVLKSTDDTTSINFGGQAAQNLSFGLDVDFKDKSRKFKAKAGIAAALTTRDIRYGASSKDTLEAIYNIDMPFDPEKYKRLFIFNTSSTILTWNNTPFFAYYFKPEYNFSNHRISAEIRRIGSDFQSFGNPYLINDRFIVSLSDRMFFFKKHLFLYLRLKHFNDNLAKINTVTYHTNMADASFNLLIKNKLPRITGGYRVYLRDSKSSESDESQYRISNYRLGLNYNINYRKTNNSLTFMFSRNDRYSFVQNGSVFTNSLNIGFVQTYPFGLNLALQYNLMLLTNDTSDLNKNNTYSIRLGYRHKSNKFRVSVKAGRIRSFETMFYAGSERNFYNADLSFKAWGNFEILLQAGKTEYHEAGTSDRNFDEIWGQVGLRYVVDAKL
ncbi:MAG: hypothetical protein K8S16_12020 [Bacteroidales bacterium]|nr:hypothetical protein [Bacteroidales bacterium]